MSIIYFIYLCLIIIFRPLSLINVYLFYFTYHSFFNSLLVSHAESFNILHIYIHWKEHSSNSRFPYTFARGTSHFQIIYAVASL